MALDILRVSEPLEVELKTVLERASNIKKMINQLYIFNGEPPKYSDVDSIGGNGLSGLGYGVFTGKTVVSAAKEYMAMVNKPVSAEEVLKGLIEGGVEFPADWQEKRKYKNLAIMLGVNPDFVSFNTNGTKSYGLASKYPEKQKERKDRWKLKKEKAVDQKAQK